MRSKAGSYASLVYRATQNKKKRKEITKNEKPLSRVSPVQYSPRRQSRWVLADYSGKDFWKRWVLSLEWTSECVMEGESCTFRQSSTHLLTVEQHTLSQSIGPTLFTRAADAEQFAHACVRCLYVSKY